VTYDRVVPPPSPAPSALLTPAVAAPPEPPPAIQEKKSEVLFLSATVYGHEFTWVRWFRDGREFQAVSNVDFNHLAGVGTVETPDSVFTVLMSLGNESREQLDALKQELLQDDWPAENRSRLPSPPPVWMPRPAYWLVYPGAADPVPPAGVAGMDALHS